ncbi:MAG TPA: hypothetical protein VKY57_12480 [Chitinispirillaceae bacterium]|nr:hypothetical protein [Chitinispirillaceae bacterium]
MNKKVFCIILITFSCFGESKMVAIDKIKEIISLKDNEYFQLSDGDVEDLSWSQVSEYDFEGIRISAPCKVDINKQNSLPVLQAIGYNGSRNSLLKESRNVIAVMYGRNGILVGPPSIKTKMIDYSKHDAIQTDNTIKSENVSFSGCKKFDLKKSLNVPWKPDIYHITFIYYDWISNTIKTELFNEKTDINDKNKNRPPKSDAEAVIKELMDNNKPKLQFTMPEKVSIRDKEIPCKISITEPVSADCMSTDSDITIFWKNLSLLFLRKNQDQKSVLRYDITITGTSELKYGTQKLIFDDEIVIDLMKVVPSYFTKSEVYCCYLVSFEKVVGPQIIKISEKQEK